MPHIKRETITYATFAFIAAGLVMGAAVFAQTAQGDIPENLRPLANELGCASKEACAAAFNSNVSKGIEMAEKYNLYDTTQKKLAKSFREEVLTQLAGTTEDNFDQKIVELAKAIVKNKPTLAKQFGINTKNVTAAETIITEVKNAGVKLDTCMRPAETLSREELVSCLNASKRLAEQKSIVSVYIPEEKLARAGNALSLEEAAKRGEYRELGVTADEIGAACLKPGSPAICDEIAKKFFGDDGIKELQEARSQVGKTEDYYKKTIGSYVLTTPKGERFTGKENIKNACDNAFKNRNIELVRACGDFAVKNGFAQPEEVARGMKVLESVTTQGADFGNCIKNPEQCVNILPTEFRNEFGVMAEIDAVMRKEIGFDPVQCERAGFDPAIGQKCFEGSKRAISQLEAIAGRSAEAQRVVNDIKRHIEEGSRLATKQQEFGAVLSAQGGPGGCKSAQECNTFCSNPANSLECLSFGAKQGAFKETDVARRIEQYTERLAFPPMVVFPPNVPGTYPPGQAQYYPGYPAQQPGNYPPGSYPSGQPGQQQPYPTQQYPNTGYYQPYPMPSPPTGSTIGPSPECFAAIQSGDFAKAKEICNMPQVPSYPAPYPGTQYPTPYPAGTSSYPTPYPYPGPQICPQVYASPCPPGQHREGGALNGCPIVGACVPDQPPPIQPGICPTLPTVASCPAGQRRTIAYSSPECGTYYRCEPEQTQGCPSGQYWNGNSCVSSTGGCSSYNNQTSCVSATERCDWRTSGSTGWCQPSATTASCGNYICESGETTSCQRDCPTPPSCSSGQYWNGTSCVSCPSGQYWNGTSCISSGPTSSSCTQDLMNLLGSGCHYMYNDSSGKAIYCDGPMTKSAKSGDAATTSGCSGGSAYPTTPGWISHTWRFKDGSTQYSQILSRTDADYTNFIAGVDAAAANGYFNGWKPGGGDNSNWQEFGIPIVSSSPTTGTGGSCPSGQYWNGTSCVSSGGGGSIQRCFYPNATRSGQYVGYTVWCEADYINCHEGSQSGPSVSVSGLSLGAPSTCDSGWSGAGSCPSGQYWNGTACVTSTTGGTTCDSALTSLLGSGCHYMYNDSSGRAIYCDGPMTKSAKQGDTTTQAGCQSGSTGTSCPSGQYWYTPPGGGSGYCMTSGSTPPPPPSGSSCSSDQVWCTSSSGGSGWCQMPPCPSSGSTGSTSCPSGQYWYMPPGGGAGYCQTSGTSGSSCSSDQVWCTSSSGGSGWCQIPPCPSSYTPPSSGSSCSSDQVWCTSSSGGGWCQMSPCPSSTPPPSGSDPATQCSQAGGSWDGSMCNMPSSYTPPPPTSDPATQCSQSGGSWDGSMCTMPPPPPSAMLPLSPLLSQLNAIFEQLIKLLRVGTP